MRRELQAGRFVVQGRGVKISGLAAHEVKKFLREPGSGDAEVFVIHRVSSEGHLELAGVEASTIDDEACLMITSGDAHEVRGIYERLRDAGKGDPPPCKTHVQFCRVPGWNEPVVLSLEFPAACQTGMASWLGRIGGMRFKAERHGLAELRAAGPQIMEECELDTWELEG